jgi:predicted GIY-YIG superfamily endonuclease
MPNYSKGKIYTIRCRHDASLIYVGSSTQTLSQRWTDHKKIINNGHKQFLYSF